MFYSPVDNQVVSLQGNRIHGLRPCQEPNPHQPLRDSQRISLNRLRLCHLGHILPPSLQGDHHANLLQTQTYIQHHNLRMHHLVSLRLLLTGNRPRSQQDSHHHSLRGILHASRPGYQLINLQNNHLESPQNFPLGSQVHSHLLNHRKYHSQIQAQNLQNNLQSSLQVNQPSFLLANHRGSLFVNLLLNPQDNLQCNHFIYLVQFLRHSHLANRRRFQSALHQQNQELIQHVSHLLSHHHRLQCAQRYNPLHNHENNHRLNHCHVLRLNRQHINQLYSPVVSRQCNHQ